MSEESSKIVKAFLSKDEAWLKYIEKPFFDRYGSKYDFSVSGFYRKAWNTWVEKQRVEFNKEYNKK